MTPMPILPRGVTSTPTAGTVEIEEDEASGLEFWRVVDQDDIASLGSPVWKLWQRGTRYHWAWLCPHCGEYFIPRFKCLVIPRIDITPKGGKERIERDVTPIEARRLGGERASEEPPPMISTEEVYARRRAAVAAVSQR